MVAKGIHEMRLLKIVHGDLRPSNLQFTGAPNGTLKIAGFSLA